MIRTRGKKDLNLGVQPVVQGVKHVGGDVWMLSENTKMRGDMTNLKKMVLPNVKSKVKLAVTEALTHGSYLCYSGVDAVNLHFANVPVHTPFIEMALIPKNGDTVKAEMCIRAAISNILVKEMNDLMIKLAGDETCTITASILSTWDASGGYRGDYFSLRSVDANRYVVDFNYHVSKGEHSMQPFLEIRILNDLKVTPFETDGIYFLPFGVVVRDIETGVHGNGPDWLYRSECLRECMSRTNTSLSYFAYNAMLRICFPGVTMKKMGIKEAVMGLIDDALYNAPQTHGGVLTALKTELYGEIQLHNNREGLLKVVTFENFMRRCRLLGLIPEVDKRTGDIINNPYNVTTFEEYKKINLA